MQRFTQEEEAAYLRNLEMAWTKAARELDFEIIAPFELKVGDKRLVYPVLIRNFGGPNGTVFMMIGSAHEEELVRIAQRMGYFCSLGNVGPQVPYDVESIKDILNDWGWHGPSDSRPKWYTGKPWTG